MKIFGDNFKNAAPKIDKCPTGKHKKESCSLIEYLENHPMANFFAGNPLIVSILAPLAATRSMKEIFVFLQDKKSE